MIDINKTLAPHALFDGHYKLLRPIDKDNGSSDFWLAIDLNTIDSNAAASDQSSGKRVMIRFFKSDSITDIEEEQRLQDEFDIAHECQHPNLIPPEEFSVVGDIRYLVFPYTKSEPLSQLVGKNMSDKKTWKLITEIASALNKLHTHQPSIIHNDIRPSNILAFDDDNFALTNYGIHLDTDNETTAYGAPERFEETSKPSSESDIWSFGATLYEVITGNKPFGDEGGKSQNKDTIIPPLTDQPTEITNLVLACLDADPKKRPTAQQICDAARRKKFHAKQEKPKQRTQHNAADEKSNHHNSNERQSKKKPLLIAASALLLGSIIYFVIPKHHEREKEDPIVAEQQPTAAVVDPYDQAAALLVEQRTALDGLTMMDSLASANNWRAIFLLSRLYFDTRGTDTVFYDTQWDRMRANCGIVADNKKAHEYLLNAFFLNENDFMILYQLGCDFKAGTQRGCKRNLDHALWCFNRAETIIKQSNITKPRYQQELEKGRDRISTVNHSPSKPTR